jgi:hypothetical protein
MTDREKLIEIISGSGILCEICGENTLTYCAEALADHILANGVTFATDTNDGCNWISVEERLPEKEFEEFTEQMDWDVYPCLCAAKNHVSGIRYVAKLFYDGSNFVDDEFVRYTSSVTHWMPLPEPPKED